jgi:hypothetical protein
VSKQDIDQLTALVKTRLTQMQYRPGLIDGFVAKTGLDLEPVTPAIKDLIHAEFRS